MDRFRVSRTPVREAIKRLFERGLVEAGPKGVAVVSEPTGEDLRKLYDLRLQLEGHAATLTATHIQPDEIERLRTVNEAFADALTQGDLVRMLEVRAQFHALAVRATRNRWLAEVLIMLRDRAYAVRHLHWQDAARAAQTIQIHNNMLNALHSRDAERYRQLVLKQIRAAITFYEKQLRAPQRSSQGRLRARESPRTSPAGTK